MAISLHVIASIIWVGGLFFYLFIVSPQLKKQFDQTRQLKLLAGFLTAFYPWVWTSIVVLLATGFWMVFHGEGGFGQLSGYVGSMMELGIAMILLLAHSFYAPFTRLKMDIAHEEWALGLKRIKHIQVLFFIIFVLGLANIYMGLTRQTIF